MVSGPDREPKTSPMLILEQSSLATRFGALSAIRSMVNGAGSAMMHGEIQAYCLLVFARTQPKRPSITHPDKNPMPAPHGTPEEPMTACPMRAPITNKISGAKHPIPIIQLDPHCFSAHTPSLAVGKVGDRRRAAARALSATGQRSPNAICRLQINAVLQHNRAEVRQRRHCRRSVYFREVLLGGLPRLR
jgi:hypothetical protein